MLHCVGKLRAHADDHRRASGSARSAALQVLDCSWAIIRVWPAVMGSALSSKFKHGQVASRVNTRPAIGQRAPPPLLQLLIRVDIEKKTSGHLHRNIDRSIL